jgi:WD40 repeat protein
VDVASGKVVRRIGGRAYNQRALRMFSPDGKLLALAGWEDRRAYILCIHSAATGKEIHRFPGPPRFDWAPRFNGSWHQAMDAAFSSDSRLLASEGEGGHIHVWDLATGEEVRRFAGHEGGVNSLTFSADGRYLVSAGEDTTAAVWDLQGPGGRPPEHVPPLAMPPKPNEEQAAKLALDLLGGATFRSDQGEDGPVHELSLGPLNEGVLAELRHFRHLRGVEYARSLVKKVPDAELALLKRVPHLRRIDLRYIPVTDADLKYFPDLRQLRVLDLRYSHVTDDGLRHLRGLTKLQELDLSHTRSTSVGLAHLKDLTDLRLLDLHGTAVDDAGLRQLAPAAHVRWVDVTGTDVSQPPVRDSCRNLCLKVGKRRGRLYDTDAGKPIGEELDPGSIDVGLDLSFSGWSFSGDGKLLVTGAGYRGESDVPLNYGAVRVWDTATGKLVGAYHFLRPIGSVDMVGFLRDGRTVVFKAQRYQTDGK